MCVAWGVSPWKTAIHDRQAPEGRHHRPASVVSPLRGCGGIWPCYQGLTPLASDCRPFGTEEPAAQVAEKGKTAYRQS